MFASTRSLRAAFALPARGVFGVHGVERDRSIDCDVTPVSDWYRVSCGFEVLLSDHDIEIPKNAEHDPVRHCICDPESVVNGTVKAPKRIGTVRYRG